MNKSIDFTLYIYMCVYTYYIDIQRFLPSPKKISSTGKKIRRGDRVEAKVKGWTKYYGGEVTRVNHNGTYNIKFDDGERKRGVTKSHIKGGEDEDDDESDFDDRSSSRKSTKKYRRGDRVEAKVKGWTKYYGGEVNTCKRNLNYIIFFYIFP